MEIPQETEDYIRGSIDHSVDLPVSSDTLLEKLDVVETENVQLPHRYLYLQSKLKKRDELIEQSRAEASMNVVALKKFVEENQKLAMECSRLLAECNKWEEECSLYDHDREALFDFANEADQKAKKTESRNHELEEEKKKLEKELHFFKLQSKGILGDVSTDGLDAEHILLDSLLTVVFGNDESSSTAHCFLEAHRSLEACHMLLKTWSSLRPATQKVVALATDLKTLEQDNDNLITNLSRDEEEVDMFFKQNSFLHKKVKRLMKQCYREHARQGQQQNHGAKKAPRIINVECQHRRAPVCGVPFIECVSPEIEYENNDSRQWIFRLSHR